MVIADGLKKQIDGLVDAHLSDFKAMSQDNLLKVIGGLNIGQYDYWHSDLRNPGKLNPAKVLEAQSHADQLNWRSAGGQFWADLEPNLHQIICTNDVIKEIVGNLGDTNKDKLVKAISEVVLGSAAISVQLPLLAVALAWYLISKELTKWCNWS